MGEGAVFKAVLAKLLEAECVFCASSLCTVSSLVPDGGLATIPKMHLLTTSLPTAPSPTETSLHVC